MIQRDDDLEPGALRRDLSDGRSIWLRPQLFNYVIIIGQSDSPGYDDDW
jgi:hypothetical protein